MLQMTPDHMRQTRQNQYTKLDSLLPQTDRATLYVSRNLVSCCSCNCRNKLFKKSTTNRSEGVTGLQSTCSKQPRRVDRRRCRQQARPSTSFVDNTVESPRRNFECVEFRTKFHGEVPLLLELREIPYSIVWWKEASMLKTRSTGVVVSIQYRLVTDRLTNRQTDTRRQHIPR